MGPPIRNIVQRNVLYDPSVDEIANDGSNNTPGSNTKDNETRTSSYEDKNNTVQNNISARRRTMMSNNDSVGLPRRHADESEVPYIDKDNTKQYMGLKKKGDFFTIMFPQLFWMAYMGIVVYFLMLELQKILQRLPFFSNLSRLALSDNKPNWGMTLAPIIIFTLYKSFHTYSVSKNIF
ncbi:hypothetical protein QKU58_gp073 [Pyramimonas orientalis virus]|uniref:Uncharacterized protein n=1 Tax=Pyramimonas orientalis virus 01B TaxID=3134525 RepID=A0A7M3UNJ7_9VIRU|nr:hypothetical protein QKU58_gp073 [Pyramimonas orientalis virus]QOI90258.1 hypothetical protein HWQ62_00121 [Pyramimonas orientalis virus]